MIETDEEFNRRWRENDKRFYKKWKIYSMIFYSSLISLYIIITLVNVFFINKHITEYLFNSCIK